MRIGAAIFLVFLWIIYLLLSGLESKGHIQWDFQESTSAGLHTDSAFVRCVYSCSMYTGCFRPYRYDYRHATCAKLPFSIVSASRSLLARYVCRVAHKRSLPVEISTSVANIPQ
eukprot:TRINITY_DN35854_c1_g1_i2.p3 TRINITY_DN35854_c1_g1~~TRINITY_DN35854_c1_g1_i2.p3  ORF type:complete len:114 (-),score=1.57 TRINITY_DN35854_c1_g1_i2:133-474(-)